jgi:hypothetical protein
MSPTHCTHPGVAIIPQSTGVAPASAPLEIPLEASVDVPLELPPSELLDPPLEEPLSEEPLEDPEPPSGLVSVPLELHPLPTAMAAAMARPRHSLNDDMAGLSSFPNAKRISIYRPPLNRPKNDDPGNSAVAARETRPSIVQRSANRCNLCMHCRASRRCAIVEGEE